MIHISDLICTLDQAKKLKQLGIIQSSRYWYDDMGHVFYRTDMVFDNEYSAWTVGELGIMLPRNIASFDCGLDIWRIANTFQYANGIGVPDKIGRWYSGTSRSYIDFHAETEAQARAAFLIHLVEGEHISIDEVNRRLG